jgi:methyl-accepting chemotaxis protein
MRNWNIGTRMALGFALVLLVMIVSSVAGVLRLQAVGDASEDMVRRSIPMERLAQEWRLGTAANLARTIALVKSDDPELRAFLQKQMQEASAGISATQKKLEAIIDTPEEKVLMKEIGAKRAQYIATRNEILKLKAAARHQEAAALTEQLMAMVASYQASLDKVAELQTVEIDQNGALISDAYRSGRIILAGLAIVALVLAVAVAWWLTRSITRPLRRAVHIAQMAAAGDLTATVEAAPKDETGQLIRALGDMSSSLAKVVADVRGGTDAIATASGQIASGNQDLSQRTEEQASSLQQTAASMEELTGTVKQNAENAREANQLAQSASEVAVKGGDVVGRVVDTMASINASSRKIVDIISVIDGIAFQTNILALNAAVEAARAGEQGRGFAVVASEVRSLAQRSASAAKEIKSLIDDSVGKVDAGSQLVGQAGQTMQEVVASIGRVTGIMGEIAAASQEQTRGIEQVNQAITQMDQVTQQNAALVEEAAAAAQSMRQQAAHLVGAVSVFKLDTPAGHAAPQERSAAVQARPQQTRSTSRNARATPAATPALGSVKARRAHVAAAGADEWESF